MTYVPCPGCHQIVCRCETAVPEPPVFVAAYGMGLPEVRGRVCAAYGGLSGMWAG